MSADLSRTGLRASDADRDRAVDVLNGAAGDGRLTIEELEERVTAALSARTLGELAGLTADLPAAPGRAEAKELVRIEQQAGSAVRSGGWVVPRRLEIESSWGDVTLDFTQAVIAEATLRIDLNMHAGTLKLVTRPGVVVDTDLLVVEFAQVKTRPSGDAGAPVALRVEIAGRMTYGQVVVRPARRSVFRRSRTP
ncbi:DUF1707 domain-containing protein [Streptomyces sp. NBC_01092]|uniref:DUF1707 SHOCT-like domain-containing protein n=1 Tax=Streptomyces sp. NBC_01092 TaxID=2903748 RepID=UPI003867A9BA|nr:DUF1707 domain-containing protein [Streptomyces sp. NBC_01092]